MDQVELGLLKQVFAKLARNQREHVGLLFGKNGKVSVYVPLRNTASIDTLFEGDPWDTIVAHTAMENIGLELIGVFHTHPCGEPKPSRLDLEGMKLWPYIWVIASPLGVKAWRLILGHLSEIGVTG